MAVRLQLLSPGEPGRLLGLPWDTPLERWDPGLFIRLVKGVSRHCVRFHPAGDRVLALKETTRSLAEHEYGMLRALQAARLPTVQVVGLVTDRTTPDDDDLDAVLLTRYLDYSLPFRYLFGVESGPGLHERLIDAAAVLLTRLHLDGFYWGDCSLSNLLFRRDAGALMAYLVDAETVEQHAAPLGDGMREADLDVAVENIAGGLLDLQAGGRMDPEVDVTEVALRLSGRYRALWSELTLTIELDPSERHLLDARLQRLNELGFDAAELVVERDVEGVHLRVRPAVIEEGHHSRQLQGLTGLDVQENQARRLLNDILGYRVWLERETGRTVAPAVAAARWLLDVYEPVVSAVPPELVGRLEPAELFHEFLEHRYYLGEETAHDVDNATALDSYVSSVLRFRPEERYVGEAT